MEDPNTTTGEARAVFEACIAHIDPAATVDARLQARSACTDDWIRTVWDETVGDIDAELFAVGGYGRQELFPHSDIDLVIHAEQPSYIEPVVREFLMALRESKRRISHAVRTPTQVTEEIHADLRTAAAYLDARTLIGSDDAAVLRAEVVGELRAADDGISFVSWLIDGFKARRDRTGQSVYLLEPDVKGGHGGLRDLQAIRWAAAVRFDFDPLFETCDDVWDEIQRRELESAFEYLCRVRLTLHRQNERKTDRLRFGDQAEIAQELLGAKTTDSIEEMMRNFYANVRTVRKLTERALRSWSVSENARPLSTDASFQIRDGALFSDESPNTTFVFDALQIASTENVMLSPDLERKIERAVATWDHENETVNRRAAELLFEVGTSWRTSERLHELGIIERVIPEFQPVVCHVHHDVYHTYTTDAHLIRCLEFARGLVSGKRKTDWPWIHDVVAEIEDPNVLLLVALTHDIGKNRGGGHSIRGASIIRDVAPRLGFSESQTQRAALLIREHLALSHAARRMDINDPRVVRDLAARVKTLEALNQLTALTFCDISTVRPDAMNDWTATLLFQLYARLKGTILHGVESLWRSSEDVLRHKRAQLRETVEASEDDVDTFIRELPISHVVETPVDLLGRQFETLRQADALDAFFISTFRREDLGTTELLVAGPDQPGTLSKIAGTLSSLGINIFRAQIVSTTRGRLIDIFYIGTKVSTEAFGPVRENRLSKVCKQLDAVLNNGVDVQQMLDKRIEQAAHTERELPPVETRVVFSNEISDEFTVFEVHSEDRIGLLYDITSALAESGANIVTSKIDSQGSEVIDTFYVESAEGQKLDDEACERSREAILARLG